MNINTVRIEFWNSFRGTSFYKTKYSVLALLVFSKFRFSTAYGSWEIKTV